MQKFDIGGAYQMMTITLNLTNSVKTGMIPTAMEVPMDATNDENQLQGPAVIIMKMTHAC